MTLRAMALLLLETDESATLAIANEIFRARFSNCWGLGSRVTSLSLFSEELLKHVACYVMRPLRRSAIRMSEGCRARLVQTVVWLIERTS